MVICQHHASAVLVPRNKSEESTGYKFEWVTDSFHVERTPRLSILQPTHYSDWCVAVHITNGLIKTPSIKSVGVLKWKIIFSNENILNA